MANKFNVLRTDRRARGRTHSETQEEEPRQVIHPAHRWITQTTQGHLLKVSTVQERGRQDQGNHPSEGLEDEDLTGNAPDIVAKSIRNRFRETPGGTKIASKLLSGPSRSLPGAPKAHQRLLGSVSERPQGAPGMPWQRPGTVWGHPGELTEASKDARRWPDTTKIDAKSCPGRKKPKIWRASYSESAREAMFG